MAGPARESLAAKLNRHRVVKDGCWSWSGSKHPFGYGWVRHGNHTLLAHRVAFEIAYGSVPFGGIVRHTCDNPECTNPDHLAVGTHADNVADKISKGRHLRADGLNANVKLKPEQTAQIPALRAQGLRWSDIAAQLCVCRQTLRSHMGKLS